MCTRGSNWTLPRGPSTSPLDGWLNPVPALRSNVIYSYRRFRMKSIRALMPTAVAASVVVGLLAYPNDIHDAEPRLLSIPRMDTFSVEVARQPQVRFCMIGGDESCPGLQELRACLASTEPCHYGKHMLLISSAH